MKKLLTSLLSQQRIAGGALVLALTQFAASLCGFLRDQAFSIMFPLDKDPVGVASVYIAAFRPSDLLFQLFVMSSLSVVLVPFLSAHLAHDRKEEMNRVTSSVLTLFGIIFGIVALLLAIFFHHLAPYFTQFTGPSLELYITYGRLALLTNFLFVFGNTLGQYLIAVQKYWVYGITPIIWSLGTIIGIYFLTPIFGPLGVMIGTIAGTIVYITYRFYGTWKSGFSFLLPQSGILHADLKEMGWLIIPRMMALGALQLQLFLFDRIGSGLGTNTVALNQFASNFESVIPGLAGIAIAQSVFSLLSQSHAKGDMKGFWAYVKKGIGYNLILTIPAAIAFAFLTPVAAWLLQMKAATAPIFMQSMMIYAIAIPFESTNHVLLRCFYSMKNTIKPAISSAISAACGISAAYLLVPTLGIFALAVGYVTAQVVQTGMLGVNLLMSATKRMQTDNC